MSLQTYIAESEKQYHLRMKTLVPLDDEIMDHIEAALAKYQPLAISRPTKTILQRAPLDFPSVEAGEVFIVDMTLGLPAAPHVIRADMRKLLNAPESYVFVRDCNEWGEIETMKLNALADIEMEAERRGLKPAALLTDPDYAEMGEFDESELYGSDYNDALISYLSSVEKEKRDSVMKVEQAPFRWLDLKHPKEDADRTQSTENYNANVADAPFANRTAKKKPDVRQSVLGSMDLSKQVVRRMYVDSNGKKVMLSRKLTGEQA